MTAAVWLNGLSLRSLNIRLQGVPRFLEGPIRTVPSAPLPTRMGGLFLESGVHELRELAIEVAFLGADAGGREAAEEVLRAHLAIGLIEIRVREASGRVKVTHGLPANRAILSPLGRLFHTRGSTWVLPMFCEDASWRAEEPVVVPLDSTPRTVPLGTAPSDFVARAYGPGTACLLQFRTAGGLLTAELPLGNLGSGEYVEVDGGAETVEEFASGTPANGLARIADAAFPPYGLTPADGEGQTVTLTGGATGDLWFWPRFA